MAILPLIALFFCEQAWAQPNIRVGGGGDFGTSAWNTSNSNILTFYSPLGQDLALIKGGNIYGCHAEMSVLVNDRLHVNIGLFHRYRKYEMQGPSWDFQRHEWKPKSTTYKGSEIKLFVYESRLIPVSFGSTLYRNEKNKINLSTGVCFYQSRFNSSYRSRGSNFHFIVEDPGNKVSQVEGTIRVKNNELNTGSGKFKGVLGVTYEREFTSGAALGLTLNYMFQFQKNIDLDYIEIGANEYEVDQTDPDVWTRELKWVIPKSRLGLNQSGFSLSLSYYPKSFEVNK